MNAANRQKIELEALFKIFLVMSLAAHGKEPLQDYVQVEISQD